MRQANAAASVFGPDGACRVFNDWKAMPGRDVRHFPKGGRQPNLVDKEDRSRAGGDSVLNALRIHVVRRLVDIDKDRSGPGVDNRTGSGYERKTGAQHLIAGFDVQCQKG
jgi:hypothetical protein